MGEQPYVTLKTGQRMPILGLGTWMSKKGEVYSAVIEAIKTGYKHIDCAWAYGNEKEIGDALQVCFKEKLVTREELFVTSKLWNKFHRKDQVETKLKETLANLQLDYLDLYLIHWPVSWGFGGPAGEPIEDVPIKETWQAMEACVDAGLTRAIGVSNFSVKKMKDVLSYATKPVAVNQVEAHPYWRNDGVLHCCQQNDIIMTAYSPLGTPSNTWLHEHEQEQPPLLLEDPLVVEIAKKLGKTPGQVLIRWAVQRGTQVIPKSVKAERIQQNFDVLEWVLPDEDFAKLSSYETQIRYVTGWMFVGEEKPLKTVAEIWDE